MAKKVLSGEEREIRDALFTPPATREELHNWVHTFLDLDLPGTIIDEDSNSTPLDMVWEVYSSLVYGCEEDVSRILYYSGRSAGKSLCESVIEVMLLLHMRGKVVHLAAIKEQSKNVQKYIKGFFSKPHLMGYVQRDSIETTEVCFYVPTELKDFSLLYKSKLPVLKEKEWKSLPDKEQESYSQVITVCEVIVATMQSVNGKHGILIMDELDVMDNINVYREAQNIPDKVMRSDGTYAEPVSVLTSTRKTNTGIVQQEIDGAAVSGLLIRHWNTLDVTERCPASRHEPEKPKITIYRSNESLKSITEENYASLPEKEKETYIKDQGYQGCLSKCKMFAFCRGRLATKQTSNSKFLKGITYVQKQFKVNTLEMFKAQHLCWKPGSFGKVYPRLDKVSHMITPAQAYVKIFGEDSLSPDLSKDALVKQIGSMGEWIGGIDFGFSHYFAFVIGFVWGKNCFVLYAEAATELEPNAQIETSEPYKWLDPKVYADPEDPKMVKMFKQHGWHMQAWKKGTGSVVGGISVVRMKLSPNGEEPELFFVRDLGEDPMMDLLYKHLDEHKWKFDAAGRITNNVTDDNKDLPDALRYMVMNKFDPKGKFNVKNTPVVTPKEDYLDGVYTVENWAKKKIVELATDTASYEEGAGTGWYGQQLEKGKGQSKGKRKGFWYTF